MKIIHESWILRNLSAAVMALFCFTAAVAQSSYQVTDLGTLSGGNFGCAMGLNNRGWTEVMDTLLDPSTGNIVDRASVRISGLKIDLGTLGGTNSWTNWGGINERGDAVGYAEMAQPDPNGEDFCFFGTGLTCRPFYWHQGKMSALATLGGNNGQASAINSRGQIVGSAETTVSDSGCPPYQTAPPVLWNKGVAQELPSVEGDPDGIAFAINDSGTAAGYTGTCTAALHAVLWQNGVATELPNLGSTTNNIGLAINNQRQIVGQSGLNATTFHAALWQNGAVTDLGTLTGDVSSFATGINEKGQIVGTSIDVYGNFRSFIWENGVMTDLSKLFPANSYLYPTMANKVNASGEISGMATDLNTGTIHAFLATPRSDAAVGGASLTQSSKAPRSVIPDSLRRRLFSVGRAGIGTAPR